MRYQLRHRLILPLLSFAMRMRSCRSMVMIATTKTTTPSLSTAVPCHHHGVPRRVMLRQVAAVTVFGSASSSAAVSAATTESDPSYPGTSLVRLRNVRDRVARLAADPARPLDGPWEEVRRKLLWAGGLKDLPHAAPGEGYTGHSFNDFNHVDLTTMSDDTTENRNDDGAVRQVVRGNALGPGIRLASLPELGPGGSWSTCAIGCHERPPRDVAHVQFRSRVAFKLVWVPNAHYDTFLLLDDDGNVLARGTPTDDGLLPDLTERRRNYEICRGGKYSVASERYAQQTMRS